MNKLNKIFLGIPIVILLLMIIIKVRKVDDSTFQLMIQDDIYQLEKICSQLNKNKLEESGLPYNFYIKKYGISICSDSEKIVGVVKKEIKLMYLKKLRFVY